MNLSEPQFLHLGNETEGLAEGCKGHSCDALKATDTEQVHQR